MLGNARIDIAGTVDDRLAITPSPLNDGLPPHRITRQNNVRALGLNGDDVNFSPMTGDTTVGWRIPHLPIRRNSGTARQTLLRFNDRANIPALYVGDPLK